MKLYDSNSTEALLGSEDKVLLKLIHLQPYFKRNQESSLYHFALLYPNEESLAFALKHLDALSIAHAPTDHGYSKTTYLEDLESNVIELYIRTVDRAEYIEEKGEIYVQYRDGHIGTGRDPLNLEALYQHTINKQSFSILPTFTQVGHLHFYAKDLIDSSHFYEELIGYGKGIDHLSFRMKDVALSDEQNHVLAFNTWKGSHITLQKEDSLGLESYTLKVSSQDYEAIKQRLNEANYPYLQKDESLIVRDPSNMKIEIKAN
jgi:catechol 2,3-dioxygenase